MEKQHQPIKFRWEGIDIFLPTVVISSDLRRIADDHAHCGTGKKAGGCAISSKSQSSIWNSWSDEDEDGGPVEVNSISNTGLENSNEKITSDGRTWKGSNWNNLIETLNSQPFLLESEHNTKNVPTAFKSGKEGAKDDIADNGLFRRKFQSKEELLRNWKGAKIQSATESLLKKCEQCGLEIGGNSIHQCICSKETNDRVGKKQTEIGEDDNCSSRRPIIPDELNCTECGKTFSKKIHLILHKKIHARMAKFTSLKYVPIKFACNVCELQFDSNNELVNHFQANHMKNLNGQSSETNVVEQNTWNHNVSGVLMRESDSITCTECNEIFPNIIKLNEHSKTHQSLPLTHKKEVRLDEFKCSKCGRTFERQNQLKFHSKLCKTQINNRNNLNEMPQKEPTSSVELLPSIAYEEFKFRCKLCNHRFYKQGGLNQHMAKAHRISKLKLMKFRCSECGRKFRHKHHLKFHMKSHVKVCKTCGLQFDEIAFQDHLKSCSDMKSKSAKSAEQQEPVTCDICGRICNGEEELSEHCLIHAFGLDEYINDSMDFLTKLQHVCQNFACQRRFSHEADLIYHVERKHLIRDPICCEVCGKIYGDETALMHHRSNEHCLNTPRKKQQIRNVLNTSGSETDTQEGSTPTYYYIQDDYPQPPEPYVLLLRDFNGPADRLLEKLSREEKLPAEADVKPLAKSFHTATPVLLTRRRKQRRGKKPREDIPFQNFYICEICNRRFQKRNLFIMHLTYHKNKNKFECHLCDKKFNAPFLLQQHIDRHNDPGFVNRTNYCGRAGRTDIPHQDVYTCEMCNKKFHNRHLYFVHLSYHKNKNKFECHLCDKKFNAPFLLQQHIDRHNDPGFVNSTNRPGRAGRTDIPHQDVYTCEMCNRKFHKRNHYFVHLAYHKNRSKYECHLCDRKFHAPILLKHHIKRHNDPGFQTNYRRRTRRTDIPHQDVYTCEICNKQFHTRHNYLVHMYYHNNKKKLPCKLCDRTFADSQSLTAHIQKHSDPNFVYRPGRGGRPDVPKQDVYYCQHCGDRKPFTDRTKYILHIRYHNLEEKFECSHCPRRFKVEANLKVHMKIHSGVKRFRCEGCLKKFKLKQTLQNHEKFCKNVPCKHKCKSCGDMFHNKITLERHVGTYHAKSRSIDPDFETPMIEHPCPHCSQTFTTTFGLTKHIAIYHPDLDTALTIKTEAEYIAHGDDHGHPMKDNTLHSVSAAGGEDEDDTSADGDPEWVPSPDDGDERDVSDMYLSNFCEAQLVEEPEAHPMPQPTKQRDWKPRVTCNCGKYKKYETQKFCHASRCPCVNAGKSCHSKCRCKNGCINKRDSESEQQKKFREGRETMLVEAQKQLEATASSNYTVTDECVDDLRTYPTPINPAPALYVGGHSISSFGHKPVIQSEFISINHETQDETMRELTLSGYVEGAEDDPLADAYISPNYPDVEFSAPELLYDPYEPTSKGVMPPTTAISKSLSITTSDGSSVSMQASSNSQGQSCLLQCHVCGIKSFKLMTAYISHMLLHSNEVSDFKCPLCESTFESVLTLVKHMDGHNQGINLQCTKCSSKFKTYADMERHLKVHHFKPMECGVCSVKFADTQVMMRHWSQQHPTCQCGVCLIKFFSHEDLTHHMKSLHSPYDCLSCNTRFEQFDELLEHFKRMHMHAPNITPSNTAAMTETLLSCNYCGAKFSTGEKLNSHLADHLTGHSTSSESDLRCNTCGQVLRSIEELTDHLSNHIQALHNKTVTVTRPSNTDTPYQRLEQGSYYKFEQEEESNMQASESLVCPQCNVSYVKRGAWIIHVRSHKLSLCSSCYQTFSTEDELEQHFQTSSCEIFKCDKCSRNFKEKKYLSQHMRVHARDVPVPGTLAASNLIAPKNHSRSGKESGNEDGGFSTAPVIVASHSLAAQNTSRNEYPRSSNHGRSASIEEITLD